MNNKYFIPYSVVEVAEKVLSERRANEIGIRNEDRLHNNLLSSQLLCFNFFVPFYEDKNLALTFLKKFYSNHISVNDVFSEHARM